MQRMHLTLLVLVGIWAGPALGYAETLVAAPPTAAVRRAPAAAIPVAGGWVHALRIARHPFLSVRIAWQRPGVRAAERKLEAEQASRARVASYFAAHPELGPHKATREDVYWGRRETRANGDLTTRTARIARMEARRAGH